MAPLVSHDLDSTHALLPGSMPAPRIGAPAVIVPVDGIEPVAGEVTVWSPGGGIVVTIRVRINLGSVTELLGTQVWVRLRAPEALIVVRGLAQPVGGRPDEIELIGVTGLAVEARRQAVRARLVRPILLLSTDGPARGTQTLDLSATGCRVRLPEGHSLQPGDLLESVVTDSRGENLRLSSEVVRVDEGRGEAALHFIRIADGDRDRLEREVLAWHSRHR
ncbi:MAG: PilZ domain-containing protein [Kineosporiaceae bacterium]|nr:PilZ domain-containing protein [Kineosporiaceae bacterium]MBK7621438.1 PilZ domain-containing protein [Kineosporiaceae bacterium]MBK8077404.1 PilZ domain-containing protein [Kineosporiaceae bacterium]